MARFHLNSKGEPGKCSARNGNCPFGEAEEHYDSPETAREAFEKQMEDAGWIQSKKAEGTRIVNVGEVGYHALRSEETRSLAFDSRGKEAGEHVKDNKEKYLEAHVWANSTQDKLVERELAGNISRYLSSKSFSEIGTEWDSSIRNFTPREFREATTKLTPEERKQLKYRAGVDESHSFTYDQQISAPPTHLHNIDNASEIVEAYEYAVTLDREMQSESNVWANRWQSKSSALVRDFSRSLGDSRMPNYSASEMKSAWAPLIKDMDGFNREKLLEAASPERKKTLIELFESVDA